MKKLQVAVIGLGRLGQACADALAGEDDMTLAGIVRRPDSLRAVPQRFRRFPVAEHVRELPPVDVALVCVPADAALGVARELIQAHFPIVECARLEGATLEAHHADIDAAANHYRIASVVGAGWSPGVLPLFTRAFEILIPRGHNLFHRHPGISLHHSAAAAHIPGVKGALAGQFRAADGMPQQYVYVELARGADIAAVRAAIAADPLFADEETQVFQVASLSELEAEEGQGMVLERRSAPVSGVHESLLLEARFEIAAFAARVMIDAARRIPVLPHGAHRYSLGI
ncbi:NAD(P)-binding domain-containing protein [Herbaspirillum sp. ST 5-3]|uniref:NAD(P)-binding domain-containing protein n=1 Tax=Oxalobacteraceae TaxID=75682 RepID=UPI001455E1ED|nr:NAD(P)-binding domain-containing protein [Herbaspirillum sp. ST 5-3]